MVEVATGISALAPALTTIGLGLAAAIALLGGCLGTAWAQSAIGGAGMGFLAERPEESGKLLLFIVIPETIVILGFVIALMLVMKIGAVP